MSDSTRCQVRHWLAAARRARQPRYRTTPAAVYALLADLAVDEAAAEAARARDALLATWAVPLFALAPGATSVTEAAEAVGEPWDGPNRSADFSDAEVGRLVALVVDACLRQRQPIPVERC